MSAITVKQFGRILYEATHGLKDAEVEKILVHFVDLLIKNKMIKKSGAIIEAYEKYVKEIEGNSDILISAAHPLSKKSIELIKKVLKSDGQEIISLDEKLLGGVVVKKDNIIFDASLKTQLRSLRQSLS